MHRARYIATGLVAAAAIAISPASAGAASLPDTDFAAGTQTGTWVVEPDSSLRIRPATVSENFDGAALATGWTAFQWPSAGTGTVGAGALTVDGARVNKDAVSDAGQVLEFRGTFGSELNQHVGFGNDLNDGPWAILSTGSVGMATGLWARTLTAAGPAGVTADTQITGVDPTVAHAYRIEWTDAAVRFFVDGALKVTSAAAVGGPMGPVISDFTTSPQNVKVDWLGIAPYPGTGSGTFTSKVLDATDSHAVWDALAATPTTPAGTTLAFETRSGNAAAPDATWSAYQPLGAGGRIASPAGRYIQYRATLGTSDNALTPSLTGVTIGYDIDTVAPVVAIDGVAVNGTAATVTFSSTATDVARFECKLDTGTFTTCTSPKQYTGLAEGSDTVAVRAVDNVANTGAVASRTFRIATRPPVAGGGPTTGTGGETEDKVAPKVGLTPRSLRASRKGVVKVRVTCPATEARCTVTVRLKYHGSTVARNTVTLGGGKAAKLSLRLSEATRLLLSTHTRLKVSGVIKARDAAGKQMTKTIRMVLRAPAG